MTDPVYSWTQPSCTHCWFLNNPDRRPVRVKDSDLEVCVHCDRMTLSGIFIRIDPKFATYPSRLKNDDV